MLKEKPILGSKKVYYYIYVKYKLILSCKLGEIFQKSCNS